MKFKRLTWVMATVIIATLLFGNLAYASSISRQVRLTITVVGRLSMDIEDEWIDQQLLRPEAEAFSELNQHDMSVDKLERNDSIVWLITKTE